jgi:hypothetical protein
VSIAQDAPNAESRVCGPCTTDHVMAARIDANGEREVCTFCGKTAKTIALAELASDVDDVFKKYVFKIETGAFEAGGHTPSEILQEDILGCNLALADALVKELTELNWRYVREGGEDYYDATSCYVVRVPSDPRYHEDWDEFVASVKHDSRFFNDAQEEYLESILGPLLRGDLHSGQPPIIEIGAADSPIRYVYRAREASSMGKRKRIYANPSRELAPPPPSLRAQGRMNAAGIRVFYGCTDVNTCVAEIRAPVGATVVVGKFSFTRPCRILDLRMLDRGYPARLSYFDPDIEDEVAYGRFIRRLHDRIRAPVLPGSESLDYLPTQVLAEYLEHRALHDLDGIMFVSSLTSGVPEDARKAPEDRVSGINVVLFAGASVVENDLAAPTVRVVNIRPSFFWMNEHVQTEPVADAAQPAEYPRNDALEPTLKLESEDIKVVRVRGIRYEVDSSGVTIEPPNTSKPSSELSL